MYIYIRLSSKYMATSSSTFSSVSIIWYIYHIYIYHIFYNTFIKYYMIYIYMVCIISKPNETDYEK